MTTYSVWQKEPTLCSRQALSLTTYLGTQGSTLPVGFTRDPCLDLVTSSRPFGSFAIELEGYDTKQEWCQCVVDRHHHNPPPPRPLFGPLPEREREGGRGRGGQCNGPAHRQLDPLSASSPCHPAPLEIATLALPVLGSQNPWDDDDGGW